MSGKFRGALIAAALGILAAAPAWAQTIMVMSVGFQDVQLIVNGQNVRSLRIGETTPEGVTLTDIQNGAAVLEVGGRKMSLRLGESTYAQTVLTANAQGHFITTAQINGVPVRAIIDTGATHVSISAADAQRMGIDYLRGQRGVSQTANGPITVYLVNLAHVQVGDIAFANISGSVRADGTAPTLIGMSFLRHVDMRRSGNTMTLLRADR